MKVAYKGTERFTHGALTYPSGPPELGTMLGPNGYGEYVTVVAHDGNRALVSIATSEDFVDLASSGRDARSVTELALIKLRRPEHEK